MVAFSDFSSPMMDNYSYSFYCYWSPLMGMNWAKLGKSASKFGIEGKTVSFFELSSTLKAA